MLTFNDSKYVDWHKEVPSVGVNHFGSLSDMIYNLRYNLKQAQSNTDVKIPIKVRHSKKCAFTSIKSWYIRLRVFFPRDVLNIQPDRSYCARLHELVGFLVCLFSCYMYKILRVRFNNNK